MSNLIAKGENINGQDVIIVEPVGKTIMEWLNELPEPYRTEALKNHYDYTHGESFGGLYSSNHTALDSAFKWENTQQGHEYWSNINRMLQLGLDIPQPEPAQLDRIEAKLTEILALLKPKSINPSLHTME